MLLTTKLRPTALAELLTHRAPLCVQQLWQWPPCRVPLLCRIHHLPSSPGPQDPAKAPMPGTSTRSASSGCRVHESQSCPRHRALHGLSPRQASRRGALTQKAALTAWLARAAMPGGPLRSGASAPVSSARWSALPCAPDTQLKRPLRLPVRPSDRQSRPRSSVRLRALPCCPTHARVSPRQSSALPAWSSSRAEQGLSPRRPKLLAQSPNPKSHLLRLSPLP